MMITSCRIGMAAMNVSLVALIAQPLAADDLDRTVLPIHQPPPKPITTLDARDAKAPPPSGSQRRRGRPMS